MKRDWTRRGQSAIAASARIASRVENKPRSTVPIPASKPNDRQGKLKCLFPLRRVGGAEAIVDFFLRLRVTILRLIAAQTEQQSSLLRAVHMSVQDEGVDPVEPFDLFVGVAERSSLDDGGTP